MRSTSAPPGLSGGGVTAPKRVLIVDDSATVRSLLTHVLAQDPRFLVVGTASDAYEAREKIKLCSPDVLTLDIEMPRMSGLDFLERLMRLRPMPVVMFSSLTAAGSAAAVRALSLGAVDCLPKPDDIAVSQVWPGLRDRLYAAACSAVQAQSGQAPAHRPAITAAPRNGALVLIGASTGGVTAIETILADLPRDWAPVVIAQHMPGKFLRSFAGRLNQAFPHTVALAEDGMTLHPGQIALAPNEARQCTVSFGPHGWRCHLREGPPLNGHRPSVDALFLSAATQEAGQVTAALLTGLGNDGAAGLKALRGAGAHCIVQDGATSVVYGMPRAAMELGAASVQLPLPDIAAEICRASGRNSPLRAAVPARPVQEQSR